MRPGKVILEGLNSGKRNGKYCNNRIFKHIKIKEVIQNINISNLCG